MTPGSGRKICVALVSLLTACVGAPTPPGSPPLMPAERTFVGQFSAGAASSHGDLLYVSDDHTADVYVFSYPAERRVGVLSGFRFPEGLCTDRSGNIFITDQGALDIVEYAHGGAKPIQVLADSKYPIACAVDPTTGNLAVANESGDISVYPKAAGQAAIYRAPFVPLFCAYDDAGNLFADGTGAPGIKVAELQGGDNALRLVDYAGRNNGEPAGLQWAGKYLAVGSASDYYRNCCGRIYHLTVKAERGMVTGKTLARGAMEDFFIEVDTVIAGTGSDQVTFFNYPKGGHPSRVLKEAGSDSYGVVLSHGR